jgi:glycosyltransferase involved in cell wall biosynthesis
VTPSYNKGRFIEETILSVKNQTYPKIEHIVIDGGSTDGTLDILKKYSDSLIWISEPDRGQSDAINKGWRMSNGEILGWLNSDDTYMPWAVETAVKYLSEHLDVHMVYGRCNLIDEYGKVIGRCQATRFNLADIVCGRCMVPQPTVFFRREVLDAVGYLDVNLHMAMDCDLWIRIGLKFKIEYLQQPIANFRVCAGTKSVNRAYGFGDDHSYIVNRLFSGPELPQEIRALRDRAYSSIHWMNGIHFLFLHQWQEARKHFTKALMLYPRNLLKMPLLVGYLVVSLLGVRATQKIVDLKRRFSLFI